MKCKYFMGKKINRKFLPDMRPAEFRVKVVAPSYFICTKGCYSTTVPVLQPQGGPCNLLLRII